MILQTARREDFDFEGPIRFDAQNRGFTEHEMSVLSGDTSAGTDVGAKGSIDVVKRLWPRDRQCPPGIDKLKSQFGIHARPYLADLISVATHQNTPLDGIIRARSAKYNFYLLTCGVFIAPEDGEKFEALKFSVTYMHPDVATFAMLPGPQTKTRLKVGGKVDVGVNGKAEFGFPEVSIQSASISAAAKAELESKFIVAFEYELKTQVVDAMGANSGFSKWHMHQGADLRGDVIFRPIITTPKSVKKLECEFNAHFKISHPSWKEGDFFSREPLRKTVSI